MKAYFRQCAWLLLAPAVVLESAPPAYAWGPHAHRIATRVAEERLSPAAREAVLELLHPGDTLVGLSNWADQEGYEVEPRSAPWHYVNVPISASHYEARFCRDGECVVEKIKHYRRLLANRRAPKAERARALLFLVHLIEDVHQPLHVGDNHDRGGNLTQVQFYDEGDNLHRLWDSTILNVISRDEHAWLRRIEPLLTPENVAAWSRGTVESWADESLQEAKKAYYFPSGAPRPLESGTRLGPEYVEMAAPIIRLRLAQAGVRVAHELNMIFADPLTR
jgi:hypothetical protein